MRTIGIRTLKAELSRVLRDVQRGDRYLVTDRGKVVAELGPMSTVGAPESSATDEARSALLRSGQLTVSEKPHRAYGALPEPGGALSSPEGTTRAIMDWLREDRGTVR